MQHIQILIAQEKLMMDQEERAARARKAKAEEEDRVRKAKAEEEDRARKAKAEEEDRARKAKAEEEDRARKAKAEEEDRARKAKAEEEDRARKAKAEEEKIKAEEEKAKAAAEEDRKMKAELLRIEEQYKANLCATEKEYKLGLLEVKKEANRELQAIYQHHLEEQRAFAETRAGELRVLTIYPELLTRGELAVYGNIGRPMYRLTDACEYMDACIMPASSNNGSGFEELGSCVKAACKASSSQETIKDASTGRSFTDAFIPAYSWDKVWKTVEDSCQVPNKMVESKHAELHRHCGIPTPFTPGTVSMGVDPPAMLLTSATAAADETNDDTAAREAVHVGLSQLAHSNTCLLQVTKCIATYSKQILECPEFLNNLALNRARQNLMHNRLEEAGVYVPDVCHRMSAEQKLKLEGVSKRSMPNRAEFWQKRQGFRASGECEVCGKTVRFEDYERAHVVPSEKGTCGTNGEHNLLVACRDCNQGMGTMDALLYKDRLVN